MKGSIVLLLCLAPVAQAQHLQTGNGVIQNASIRPGQSLQISNSMKCVSFELTSDFPVNIKENGCHVTRAVTHSVFTCPKAAAVTITDTRPQNAAFDQSNDIEFQCKMILAP